MYIHTLREKATRKKRINQNAGMSNVLGFPNETFNCISRLALIRHNYGEKETSSYGHKHTNNNSLQVRDLARHRPTALP